MDSRVIRCQKCGANNRIKAEGEMITQQPVCGQCRSLLPTGAKGSPSIKVTDSSFRQVVETSLLPVFLDFWAGWCGPCLMISPIIEELAKELAGKIVVAKINVDENPATAARFGVSSIPTMVIFNNGREVARLLGAVPKETMISKLQSLRLI